MRGWLAAGLVCLVVLSGCASKGSGSSSTSGTAASSATHGGSTTATLTLTKTPAAQAAANHAPVVLFGASHGNGTAALNVTFQLKLSDADGGRLNWTVSFGDKTANRTGSAQLANATRAYTTNVTHGYAAAGLFNATLSVTDGLNTTRALLRLNLTSSAAALPAVVFTGHIVAFDPTTTPTSECFLDLTLASGGPSDTVGNIHQFPHPMDGWSYKFSASGYWTQFWKGSGAILGSGASGTVPKGSDNVWVCGKDATTSNTNYTLTLSPA